MSRLLTPRRTLFRRTAYQAIMDPRALHPAGKLGTYGDEFDQKVIDPKWNNTAGTSPSTALAIAGSSWASQVCSANGYCYQAAPSGDFTLYAGIQQPDHLSSNLDGILILDGSGNGVGLSPYFSSPDQWLFTVVTAGLYGGAFNAVGSDTGLPYGSGTIGHYRINKVGTSYTAQVGSRDGTTWSAASTALTGPTTATRIGLGRWQNLTASSSTMRIDWIDVVQ